MREVQGGEVRRGVWDYRLLLPFVPAKFSFWPFRRWAVVLSWL